MTSCLIIGIGLLAALSAAQDNPSPGNWASFVLVLPGAADPISLEQIEESSSRRADGTSFVETLKTKVYRDSSGRLLAQGEFRQGTTSTPYIDLIDPVKGSRVLLLVSQRIGYRLPWPISNATTFNFFVSCADQTASSDDWITTTQKLGTRTIEGITFEGMRFSQTSRAANMVNTREQWYSEDLKLLASVVVSCGNRTWSTHIRNLRREEPDPSLFIIPAKYKILDQDIRFNQQ